jgi:hypothetical protein
MDCAGRSPGGAPAWGFRRQVETIRAAVHVRHKALLLKAGAAMLRNSSGELVQTLSMAFM